MKTHENDLIREVEGQELAAKNVGFYWESLQQIIQQIHSECAEISQAFEQDDRMHLQEEVGDLLQAAIGLSVFCELNTHETLQKSIQKFQKRFDAMIELARRDGLETLHNQTSQTLLSYWDRAKKI